MDTKDKLALLHASVDLELNVSNLYMLYSRLYAEDSGFWWQLSLEEKNHAALLRSAEHYIDLGKFPDELLYAKLDAIRGSNSEIAKRISAYGQSAPSAEEAYRYAMHLEGSAAELHFHKTMARDTNSRVMRIFQKLCGEDRDHLDRIQSLMRERGFLPLK